MTESISIYNMETLIKTIMSTDTYYTCLSFRPCDVHDVIILKNKIILDLNNLQLMITYFTKIEIDSWTITREQFLADLLGENNEKE